MNERTQSFDPRQIMEKRTFEIFHYKSPRQANVAIHHHDFYEVYFFMGGSVEYRVEGRVYHLTPGDLLLIGPMELHQAFVQADECPYERIVLWIDRTYLEECSQEDCNLTQCFDPALPLHTNLLHLSSAQKKEITRILSALVEENYSASFGADICAKGLFLQLLTSINRLALQRQPDTLQEVYPSLIEKITRYLSENYAQPLTLEEIAKQFYVNKYYLSHTFRKVTGTSPYKYLQLKRLLIAREMLLSGKPSGEVARMCGFSDYTGFYRAFRAQYGVSPRAIGTGS